MSRLVMKAREASGEIVPLAGHEKMLGMYFNVNFALLYPGSKASPSALAEAFNVVLDSFQVLAGRLVLREGGLAILCNNEGVPLIHEECARPAPSFDEPIPCEVFDMVSDSVPNGEGPGGAPIRVKVSDFEDAQVIAISINHGLCDAGGLGRFLAAWAEAYSGGSGARTVSNDRVGTAPATPEMGGAPLSPPEEIPRSHAWRTLRHLPEQCPALERAPLASPVVMSVRKSADECKALKARCLEAAGLEGSSVSTNDALCAELAASLGLDADRVPISLLMDYRTCLGAEAVFGNLWTSLELCIRNSLAGAVDIREGLPIAQSAEFVKWLAGQGANPAWPGKLMMNTWTKALQLSELAFAGPAADVMLGAPMLEQRLAMMAPAGVSYVIGLPQSDGGVKLVGVLPAAASERLTGKVKVCSGCQ